MISLPQVTSLETQQKALSLLMGLIQRHLEGTPAQRWYQKVVARRPRPASAAAAQQGLVRGAGSQRESRGFACGALLYGALLWLAGAAPWALPAAYLLFAAVAMPWRLLEFGRSRNAFFLVDFCYVRIIGLSSFVISSPMLKVADSATRRTAHGTDRQRRPVHVGNAALTQIVWGPKRRGYTADQRSVVSTLRGNSL